VIPKILTHKKDDDHPRHFKMKSLHPLLHMYSKLNVSRSISFFKIEVKGELHETTCEWKAKLLMSNAEPF